MSYWTHINGTMTVNLHKREIIKRLGTPFTWEDMYGSDKFEKTIAKIFYKGKRFKLRENKLYKKFRQAKSRYLHSKAERKYWCESNPIPKGSEGSIQYEIKRKGKYNTVYFHGDLRDFWETQPILDWVDRLSESEDNFENVILECGIDINLEGVAPYRFERNGYKSETWWSEYRMITEKEYEKRIKAK